MKYNYLMMKRANNIDKCMEDCELEAPIGGLWLELLKKVTHVSVRVVILASESLIFQ
jgi:hypothetical protein